jgi:hypothetical protein
MKPTREELVDALRGMVEQYLSLDRKNYTKPRQSSEREEFTHDWMRAGQHALDVMKREGLMDSEGGNCHYWFKENNDEEVGCCGNTSSKS